MNKIQKNLISILSLKKCMSLEINCNDVVDLNGLATPLLDFVSVTWLGNFSEDDPKNIRPIKIAQELVSRNITVLLHITSRNLDKVSALKILECVKDIGVRNILALEGESKFVMQRDLTEMDFPYTSHFVEFIKQNFQDYFTVGVTGYPQKHPRSSDMKQEMEFLQLKVSKGADFILTQGCLDKRAILEFHNLCETFSISLPIVVGSFILTKPEHIEMMKRCNIPIEDELFRFRDSMTRKLKPFERYFRDNLREIGDIVLGSRHNRFAGLHLFSTNNPDNIFEIKEEFTLFAHKFQLM